MSELLVYGAYGYTGQLIARFAEEAGRRPILAGRSEEKVRALAERHGFQWRAFGLDDPAALDAGLDGVAAVLHCAGPFSRTSRPMLDACLRTKVHYLDITGEVVVFEAAARRDDEAKEAGILVMPGTGFDVVPTDCLALHLKEQLPSATHLTLAFMGLGAGLSHGTATTMVEGLSEGSAVRRDGRLVKVRAGSRTRPIDFGRGPRPALGIPWGDISTAWRSTGIPNIEVFMGASTGMVTGAKIGGFLGPLLGSGPVQRMLKRRIDRGPAGPSDAQRAQGKSLVWGEVTDANGGRAEARLTTPEGYTLTAMTALEIGRRAVAGEVPVGYQTPAMAFGADFILEFDGVEREAL